jgi:hypothetical protein
VSGHAHFPRHVARTTGGVARAVPRSPTLALAALSALAVLGAAPRPAHAGRWFVDVEPLAIRRADDRQLPSMFTVSVGRVRSSGVLRPFIAAGSGFLNVQARAGVMALSRGSAHSGPTMLVQVRAMHAILCGEQGLFGGFGLGYRWWREGNNPFGLMATVEAGPARLRPDCGDDVRLEDAAVERAVLGGGSMSFTVGF